MKRFQITGVHFSKEVSYFDWDKKREFPEFEKISSVDLGTMSFENLDAAQRWLAEKHPDLYFGANIIEVAPEKKYPDFMMIASKGYYYSLGITNPMDAIKNNV